LAARLLGARQPIIARAAITSTAVAATLLVLAVGYTDALASEANVLQSDAEATYASATIVTTFLEKAVGNATDSVLTLPRTNPTFPATAIVATVLPFAFRHAARTLVAANVGRTFVTFANWLGTTIELFTEAGTWEELDPVNKDN